MNVKFLLASLALTTIGSAFAAVQTPVYNEITLPSNVSTQYFRGSLIFADYNADNNMDLMVKGRDLANGWSPDVFAILTDSDGALIDKQNLSNDGQSWERTLTVLDFNNDGNIDYLLSSAGYELYKNNGDGTSTKMDNFALESNISIGDDNSNTERWYMGITAVADFDLDGYQDLVVMDSDGNPVLYKNNGGDGSFTKVDSGLCAQRGGTMAVGDYNNDGYPDLLVTGWNDSFGNHCIRINKNNGDGTFTTVAPNGLIGSEKGQIIFVDANSDGLLDIFVTGESCPEGWNKIAYLFKNNGDDTFTKVATEFTGAATGGADWVDVNGDGLMDIVYCGQTSNNSNVVVAINEGDLVYTAHESLLCRARGGAAIATYDINKNGFPCIAVMGYNDGEAKHLHLFNGICSRNANIAPSAPTEAKATAGVGCTTFTWKAGSDNKTPVAALRYNVYVKLNDGKIITVVPADPATGALRIGDVNASLTTCSYKLNIAISDIAEWGVQTIDGGKASSAFTKGEVSGVEDIVSSNEINITYTNGNITSNVDATISIIDTFGRTILSTKAVANEAISANLASGIYLVKAATTKASKVIKIQVD